MSDGLKRPVSEEDHVAGPGDAPVTLVEYGDFECPYCGAAYPIVHAIQKELGDALRFVFRHFPLTEIHPHAEHAAEAAESAGAQGKFWQMHAAIFEHQKRLTDDDLTRYASEIGADAGRVQSDLEAGAHRERVQADFMSGVRSGVNGTPTFFVNGKRYDGLWHVQREFMNALKAVAAK